MEEKIINITCHIDKQIVIYRFLKEEEIIIPIPEELEKRFDGWFIDKDQTIPFNLQEEIQSDITLYAKMKINIEASNGLKMNFINKLSLAEKEVQDIYVALNNELKRYEGINQRLTNSTDNYYVKRSLVAKISLSGKTIKLYLNLDPTKYEVNKYHHSQVEDKKKFEEVPFCLKVKSARSLKKAKLLISDLSKKFELTLIDEFVEADIFDILKQLDYEVISENHLQKFLRSSITAVKADGVISNEFALTLLKHEDKKADENTEKEVIFIDDIAKVFINDDIVDLNKLKEKGILQPSTMAYKVSDRGLLDKALTIIADDFSPNAVKMIALTKGQAIKLG